MKTFNNLSEAIHRASTTVLIGITIAFVTNYLLDDAFKAIIFSVIGTIITTLFLFADEGSEEQ